MKFGKKLIGALLVGILALAPSAFAVSISVSSDTGGFTENINAGDKDSVYASAMIGPGSLTNSIRGSGNLLESHWVSNSAGAYAGVGVDIRKAESYDYGYTLTPGIGSSWKASKYPVVSASETLDVLNANYINAYANSFNAKGEYATVSTVLDNPGKKASLTGYSNSAIASAEMVFASQSAESASAPSGLIRTEAASQLVKLRIFPLDLRMEVADASTVINKGSISGYSDQATASNDLLEASQHIDSASGKQISSQSQSIFCSANLFKGLKMSGAGASTTSSGDLTGYDGNSRTSSGLVEAQQSGHIEGAFTSKAVAGSASKTRSSNYGDKYDLNMQAKRDASGSYASGNLGYYVDSNDRKSSRIQGAVDASESGDAINVASGTYYENVQIDKSLTVKGSGAGNTIVDGQRSGSVFTIGKNNQDITVTLSDMAIQGGSGTSTDLNGIGSYSLVGGGIWNAGRLTVARSTISGNTAQFGGGIANSGTTTITDSVITGNSASNGGGICNYKGTLDLVSGSVDHNIADLYGGGIYNSLGTLIGNMSIVHDNTPDQINISVDWLPCV